MTTSDRAGVAAAPGLSVDEKMLRWVAAQPVGFGDWACRDCRPDSDMIVDDFRCMVHEARARLTAKPLDTGGSDADAD